MSKQKNFAIQQAASKFFSQPQEEQEESRNGRPVKKGEKKKVKSFTVLPSVYADAKKVAFMKRENLSNIVNDFLENYAHENLELIKEYDKLKG